MGRRASSGETELTEPVDADADIPMRARRRELRRSRAAVLGVIAIGGGLGAAARYGLTVLLPTEPGGFVRSTFTTNVLGCFLIGGLMVLITEVWSAHRLVRPFLGVGVLGGFTTFSTYALDFQGLLQPGTVWVAFAYLFGTLLAALLAVLAGVSLTRAVTRRSG